MPYYRVQVIYCRCVAEDVTTNSMVALKLMTNKVEWLREQDMRKLCGGVELDSKHVMQVLVARELEEDAGMLDSRLNGAGRFLLVMEKAGLKWPSHYAPFSTLPY